ncbi:MAG: D-glycero-beta-D-manno-heptose 1-phosphate adenylyltransferase [Verrucomicrobia bacterium]|nr:D-glycero-beta-D-manno-heptose 1-phosphate adenylyltransferase [Verrucomicrobiota bacterium]MBV8275566.1 D-glycero-beta-D-manno-heptose 1-phosphate adenylyltransferase [Verrucomicrobiota bacterium]
MLGKIVPEAEAAVIRKTCAEQRLVFTNGCFDILHVGHIRYLTAAKQLGDILVVGLNSDDSVRQLKGPNRPINSEADRAEVLAALAVVDHVVIFREERVSRLVTLLRPDLYVKGGDYSIDSLDRGEVDALRSVGAEIKIVPLVPGRSTTRLINAIQNT